MELFTCLMAVAGRVKWTNYQARDAKLTGFIRHFKFRWSRLFPPFEAQKVYFEAAVEVPTHSHYYQCYLQ